MPNQCVARGCTVKQGDEGYRLFRFPQIREQEKELTERRLKAWVKAVNRKGLTIENIKYHTRICSAHFSSGKYLKYLIVFQVNLPL